MSENVNMLPGSTVLKSGEYKCNVCMEGGMLDHLIGGMLKEIGAEVPDDVREARKICLNAKALRDHLGPLRKQLEGEETVRSFNKGERFTECPNCGAQTGWTLTELL